jgi:abelson tyrosine-protein kinase 1
MNDNSKQSTEHRFLEHSVALLQRQSGRVIKIESWTVSSFEIEKEHKIGSGGFSTVFKGVFLGAPVAIKELAATTSPKARTLLVQVNETLTETSRCS